VASLAVLGDSTAAGMGDPLSTGGWRGFGPLLAAALGAPSEVRYTNLSIIGARMADLRHRQLPGALAARPDVAVIVAGMNDTLRSDFDGGTLCKVPWLARRGRDLLPHSAGLVLRDLIGRSAAVPSRCVR
jgi:lysophospholipase L1-like esterase